MNSNDYSASVARTHDALKLPSEYLPLDNFQGEYGFFHNKNSEEVLRLGLGAEWRDFQEGKLLPQWADFSSFLEWYSASPSDHRCPATGVRVLRSCGGGGGTSPATPARPISA